MSFVEKTSKDMYKSLNLTIEYKNDAEKDVTCYTVSSGRYVSP